MYQPSLWQILCIFIIYQRNVGYTLLSSSNGTNFTQWSEDDWFETRFLINTKFMFNRQRYENLIVRTRMNEWSLELSYGNQSYSNKLWTELNVFLNDRTSLNNSISGHIRNICHPPIISPLTNDSNTYIPELSNMDRRVANYFIYDGFFRTINYIHCQIDERRRNPSLHTQFNIYLVTNRDFQSLIYFDMPNATRQSFIDLQARFYLHNYERNFKYNFNISDINYSLDSNTSFIYMIKLYNQNNDKTNNSMIISSNIICICFLLLLLIYKMNIE